MTDRPAAARRPVRTAPRRGAARTPGRPTAAPERRYALIKWALLAALVANSARNVDFAEIRRAMAASPGVASLNALDENGFQERMDATPEGCADWLMYGSDDIMDVSELMIARGDEATLDRLEDAFQGRLEAQLAVFRSYGVNQKDLLEGATVLRRGDYLFYAVGEAADRWADAFLACIR